MDFFRQKSQHRISIEVQSVNSPSSNDITSSGLLFKFRTTLNPCGSQSTSDENSDLELMHTGNFGQIFRGRKFTCTLHVTCLAVTSPCWMFILMVLRVIIANKNEARGVFLTLPEQSSKIHTSVALALGSATLWVQLPKTNGWTSRSSWWPKKSDHCSNPHQKRINVFSGCQ